MFIQRQDIEERKEECDVCNKDTVIYKYDVSDCGTYGGHSKGIGFVSGEWIEYDNRKHQVCEKCLKKKDMMKILIYKHVKASLLYLKHDIKRFEEEIKLSEKNLMENKKTLKDKKVKVRKWVKILSKGIKNE